MGYFASMPRSNRRRLMAVTLGVLVGLVGVDLALGKLKAEESKLWPPLGTFQDPALRVMLEKRLGRERVRASGANDGFDAELGWVTRPGAHKGALEEGWINSIGARGKREYSPLPEPGRLRVVCVGDSFTFGSEVEDTHSWPARLEAADASIEALNFGVGGYGTDQALLRLRRDACDLGAQAVVTGLLLENILRNVNRLRPLLYADVTHPVVKPRFLLVGGELELLPHPFPTRAGLLESALAGELRGHVAEHEFWTASDPWPAFSNLARWWSARQDKVERNIPRLWQATEDEPYRLTLALLEAMRDQALDCGAEHFAVILFLSRPVLESFKGQAPAWYQHLLADLAARGITAIDLYAQFLQAHASGDLYLQTHFTPAGNALAAEAVRAWLAGVR
ncbi:MAG: hypothetical protein ACI8QC_002568 [Planctomycetota bacterium]|jgi:hypothetical protein